MQNKLDLFNMKNAKEAEKILAEYTQLVIREKQLKGIIQVLVDEKGRIYKLYPDNRKEYLE